MKALKIRLAARCESAGRQKNEDNYQIGDNLNDDHWGFSTDAEIELSPKGTLLVVADGMGGLKSGEVASSIAVETIKKWFSSERLTKDTTSSPEAVRRHVKKAIQAADHAIKHEGADDKSKKGMGSTIALAWLLGEQVHVGWCGDSRVYRFNPANGLTRLSHDHSFVQELVDLGKLEPELAFDYPDSHIITRSLGDLRSTANPDIKSFPLRKDDIFLLCSDGLTGVLRDREIEVIFRDNRRDMETLRNALWTAAYEAGWNDNVTIVLCEILSETEEVATKNSPAWFSPAWLIDTVSLTGKKEKKEEKEDEEEKEEKESKKEKERKKIVKWLKILIPLLLAGIAVGTGAYYLFKGNLSKKKVSDNPTIVQKDSVNRNSKDTLKENIWQPVLQPENNTDDIDNHEEVVVKYISVKGTDYEIKTDEQGNRFLEYLVKQGDSFYKIAILFKGLTPENGVFGSAIIKFNPDIDTIKFVIRRGEILKIPLSDAQ
ncbi:MAG: protein phosphatase 2C domain-containing protein [Tannerella sp.]|jgi:protein phosphatase|nr:protein phosphatase 2C domain-containing protein [Tannerella sp.]